MNRLVVFLSALVLCACTSKEQPATTPLHSEFKTEYIQPVCIVQATGSVTNADHLLKPYAGQVSTSEPEAVDFRKGGSVLIDFGRELQGGIEITRSIAGSHKAARFRLCLGESVSEAMSNVDAEGTTATNDHSARDIDISVPWLGTATYGNSGFRFARLDLLDDDGENVGLVAVRAVSRQRDIPVSGSFRCSNDRLNQIWQTGAYTVHLCMQDYLWDGIKRDRLVWMGDMHPEVMTLNTVFGNQDIVEKSLDYVRDNTPADEWMNGICSYSLWWIILQQHLYQWYGNKAYLLEQQDYLTALLHKVIDCTDGNREAYREGRFIDWPSADLPDVIHAGLQALTVRALQAGADMAGWLGDEALQEACSEKAQQLLTYTPDAAGNSQAAALMALQGMMSADEAARIIIDNGPERFTSFMGYYLLEALALNGNYEEALRLISDYWGSMIDLGATTFWEDFNYEDGKKAGRIDKMPADSLFDIHGDGGAYCYVGLRHSFCHGWASGPTAWLSRHILGIEPVGIGFSEVRINPHLGNLDWAEGTFPTPYGLITVKHTKRPDGTINSQVTLPKGIKRKK